MFFKLKHQSKKTGLAPVFVCYKYEGKETLISTGVSLLPEHFDKKSGKVRKQDAEHAAKYRKISDAKRSVEVLVELLVKQGYTPTCDVVKESYELRKEQDVYDLKDIKVYVDSELTEIEQLKLEIPQLEQLLADKKALLHSLQHIFTEGYTDTSKILLVDKILDYIKLDKNNYRKNTLQGYKNLAVLIKAFKPKLGLEEINLEVLGEFKQFLNKKEYRNRSVIETFKRLKVIIKHFAKEYKLSTDYLAEFKMLKVKQNDNIIYLTQEELEALENLELESAHQRQVQKQFLFCCYTALRISDIHINEGNIHNLHTEENGTQRRELRVTMTKTDNTVFIPLTPKAEAILNSPEFPFKKIPLNHYNKALQSICKRLPILDKEITLTHFVANSPTQITKPKWQLISSHVGRKTAINTWLSKEVSETVVGEWAGHVDTTMLRKHYQDKKAAANREAHKIM